MNAVGQPISRIDGRLKVTGSARYTADIPLETIVHAAIVYSTIANGRTVSIDTAAAENAPGVLAVLTHKNMPRMNALPWSHLRPQGQTYLPLQDDQIHYAGQPVALVVAADARPSDLCRHADQGRVRNRPAGGVRPADGQGGRR